MVDEVPVEPPVGGLVHAVLDRPRIERGGIGRIDPDRLHGEAPEARHEPRGSAVGGLVHSVAVRPRVQRGRRGGIDGQGIDG